MQSRRFVPALVAALALAAPPAAGAITPDIGDFDELQRQITALEDQNTRPLLATAEAATAAFMRGQPCPTVNILGALRNQLEAKGIDNPDFRPVFTAVDDLVAAFPADPCMIDNPDF